MREVKVCKPGFRRSKKNWIYEMQSSGNYSILVDPFRVTFDLVNKKKRTAPFVVIFDRKTFGVLIKFGKAYEKQTDLVCYNQF